MTAWPSMVSVTDSPSRSGASCGPIDRREASLTALSSLPSFFPRVFKLACSCSGREHRGCPPGDRLDVQLVGNHVRQRDDIGRVLRRGTGEPEFSQRLTHALIGLFTQSMPHLNHALGQGHAVVEGGVDESDINVRIRLQVD